MNKYFLILLFIPIMFMNCDKTDRIYFSENPNIIFDKDSNEVSWLKVPTDTFIYKVKCKLVGQALDAPTDFIINVIDEETSATEGLTYLSIPETVTWPKDSFEYHIPISLINNDPRVFAEKLSLSIELVGSKSLGVNFDGIRKHKVNISCLLVKPYYWDRYNLSRYFGLYSKVKHGIIIKIMGSDFPESQKAWKRASAIWQQSGMTKINQYFIDNVVVDESGNVIESWM